MADAVTVDIKPWWQSRIIWTQVVGVLAYVGTRFGLDLDAATQEVITQTILGVVTVLTIFLKGAGKPTATPTQAKKA